VVGPRGKGLRNLLKDLRCEIVARHIVKKFTIVQPPDCEQGLAPRGRTLANHIKYRLPVGGRPSDDVEHLAGCGLVLVRLKGLPLRLDELPARLDKLLGIRASAAAVQRWRSARELRAISNFWVNEPSGLEFGRSQVCEPRSTFHETRWAALSLKPEE
jgi:hypothetical protein